MGIYRCRDCGHQGLGQRLWTVRSLCVSKYPTRYQFTPKYSWKCCSGLLWGEEPALIQECVNWAQQRKSREIWACGSPAMLPVAGWWNFCHLCQREDCARCSLPTGLILSMTTIFHEGWRVSLPRQGWRQWRHKLFLLPKISGEADREMLVYSVVDSFSLFLCWSHALCLTQCNLAHKAHQQTLKSRHSLWASGPLLHHPHIPKQPTAR